MVYNSLNFILVFPLLFILYYAIPARYERGRNGYLLLVSYLLYMQFDPMHALILLGVTTVTYLSALYVEKTERPKLILTLGVVLTLLPLAFFKYFGFVSENIRQAFALFDMNFRLQGLNWVIPIGISFFTFQALGYLWDVYYRRQQAERDFLTYALFVSFFPSILSGPINKASLIIPQLKKLRPYFDYPKAVEGLKFLLWGMFMKVTVADRVALYVDTVLPNYMHYSGLTCLAASFLYSIQIYADFAGYSLMALGVGKVLGFELTENFRRPYFAESITDFWHRWHISLSTWLKDYVYIPLGGSRCSRLRNYWNIFVTFLVSGIWHGANWTFILWGCMHGIFQIIEKMTGQQKCDFGRLGRILKILVTFLLVNFAWIFFRMPSLEDATGIVARIFNPTLPLHLFIDHDAMKYGTIPLLLLIAKDSLDEFFPTRKFHLLNSRSKWVRWSSYLVLLMMILLFCVFGTDQFIYANF